MKYMIFIETLKLDRIIHTSQNKNREFFSLFVYICVNGMVFSSVFIYKDDSRLLQDI